MRVLTVLLALALAGCESVQSPLDPWGVQAGRIASLAGVLLIGGTAGFALVMALIGVAIIAPDRLRRALGSRGFVLAGGIGFPAAALVLPAAAGPAFAHGPTRQKVSQTVDIARSPDEVRANPASATRSGWNGT